MRFFKTLLIAIFATSLVSCGGGGGDAGSTASTSGTGTGTTTTASGTTTTTPATVVNGVGGSTTQTDGAISIAIGYNDKIEVSADDQQYLKNYIIKVVDKNGFPIKGAVIAPRVDMVGYGKGYLNDPEADPKPTKTFTANAYCPSEDINLNDSLDAGEDTNGDGVVTPARAIVAIQAVNGLVTNNDGTVLFQAQYPKNFAYWIIARLTVTTKVNSTEGRSIEEFRLPYLAGDEKTRSAAFGLAPFGISGQCTDTD